MEHRWGDGSRFQIAVEKPSGEGRDSLGSATQPPPRRHRAGFSRENCYLADHWLSFFMNNKHLPDRRQIVELLLGIVFSTREFQKIAGTKYEEQGAVTVAASEDLGQLRDTVQSPLLEVLAVRMRTLKTPIPVSLRVDGVERLRKSVRLLRIASRPRCEPHRARGSLPGR